jgi:hypothetical protein
MATWYIRDVTVAMLAGNNIKMQLVAFLFVAQLQHLGVCLFVCVCVCVYVSAAVLAKYGDSNIRGQDSSKTNS